MSEYWVSQARKFCDFCKCWITDNKPSVEFHERGKRHKEAVELRLKELRKKSLKDSYDQEQLDKDMAKMEKAAMEAFKKDLKDNPELAKQYGVSLEPKPKPKSEASSSNSSSSLQVGEKRKCPVIKEWYEAVSPEGYTYFWSTKSGESKWEAPEDYMSLAEQKELTAGGNGAGGVQHKQEDTQNTANQTPSTKSKSTKQTEEPEVTPIGPAAFGANTARSAYGGWEVVREEAQPVVYDESSAAPDLDEIPLPACPTVRDVKPEKKFKEKTVSSLGLKQGGAPVAFKKRKIAAGARNVRQKGDDD